MLDVVSFRHPSSPCVPSYPSQQSNVRPINVSPTTGRPYDTGAPDYRVQRRSKRRFEEQIEQAQANVSDQYAAVYVAAGIVPLIESRLQGHDYLIAVFQLNLQEIFRPNWWKELAESKPEDFAMKSSWLLERIKIMKDEVAHYQPSPQSK
jgi:hypothetical protein